MDIRSLQRPLKDAYRQARPVPGSRWSRMDDKTRRQFLAPSTSGELSITLRRTKALEEPVQAPARGICYSGHWPLVHRSLARWLPPRWEYRLVISR